MTLHLVRRACDLPEHAGRSLGQWDCAELARQLVRDEVVASISPQTVQRLLASHRLKPWRSHVWLHPRPPRDAAFAAQVRAVADLLTRLLGDDERVLSLDEMDVGVSVAASVAMLVVTIVGGQLLMATSAAADVAPAAGRSCIERPLASPDGPGAVGVARLCLTVDDVETAVELDGLTGGALYTAWLGYQERPVGGANGPCASAGSAARAEQSTPSQVDAAPAPRDGRLRLARTLPGLRPPSNTVLDVLVAEHGPAFAVGTAARSRQLLTWDRAWAGLPASAIDHPDDAARLIGCAAFWLRGGAELTDH